MVLFLCGSVKDLIKQQWFRICEGFNGAAMV